MNNSNKTPSVSVPAGLINYDELARGSPQLRALLDEAQKQARKVSAATVALEQTERAYIEASKQVLRYAEYIQRMTK